MTSHVRFNNMTMTFRRFSLHSTITSIAFCWKLIENFFNATGGYSAVTKPVFVGGTRLGTVLQIKIPATNSKHHVERSFLTKIYSKLPVNKVLHDMRVHCVHRIPNIPQERNRYFCPPEILKCQEKHKMRSKWI